MAVKLNVKAFANSFAVVAAILYIVCIALLWISLEFSIGLGNYIFHGLELNGIAAVRSVSFSAFSLVLGTILAWIIGYALATFYNKFA